MVLALCHHSLANLACCSPAGPAIAQTLCDANCCRYAIPLVQKILEAKQLARSAGNVEGGCVRALVLVPSKELSQQAATNIAVRSGCEVCVFVLHVCNV